MPKLAVLVFVASTWLAAPVLQADWPPFSAPDRDPEIAAQKRAVADLRNVGTALYSWRIDQAPDISSKGDPEAEDAGPCDCDAEGKMISYDIRDVPEISWEALRAIVVPQYLRELPKNDPWGNPYEYRLKIKNVRSRTVISIRSAGSDGRFNGDRYEVRPFLPGDTAEDLVWADGYFLRWPETPKPEKVPVKK